MSLDFDLVGNAMQMAVCRLQPGQTVFCEAGKFLFSSANLTPETKIGTPSSGSSSGGRGGFMQAAMNAGKRMLAGESLAFQYFTNNGREVEVLAFAGVLPGEMRAIELDGRTTWFAEKDAFIAAESGVNFDIAFSGLRQGFAGGEGFILEKFSGYGTLLVGGAGNFIDLNPADFGGTIKVDTGCIVAFEDSVRYDITTVGRFNRQGAMAAMFGGEGLTLAALSGNGRVVLQSLTIEGLATALRKNMLKGGGDNGRTGISSITGLLGGND